jgi:hypothetical protein
MSGGGDEIAAFDRAVDGLLRLDAAIGDLAEAAVSSPMGRVLGAYLALIGTEAADLPTAVEHRAVLAELALNDREQRHVVAIDQWIAGRMFQAGEALDALLLDYPHDSLALAVGHQVDFFTGNAIALRDRIGRSLPVFANDDRRGYVLGMYAFGVEEAGHYDRSEPLALEALELHANDVWAVHAATHTYEMQGRTAVGRAFLDSHRAQWAVPSTFFDVHLHWHDTLFALAGHDVDGALAIHDAHLHHAESGAVNMELLDATSLLWRLHLDGVDTTAARWDSLADAWQTKTACFYAFNDMHMVMAFVGAGRLSDAHDAVGQLERYVETGDSTSTNHAMTRSVGLPIAAAMLAFGQDRYDDVVSLLAPIRTVVNLFGGSHAQRDVVQRTLLEAAIRGGHHSFARGLVAERLSLVPSSTYARAQSERVHALSR